MKKGAIAEFSGSNHACGSPALQDGCRHGALSDLTGIIVEKYK